MKKQDFLKLQKHWYKKIKKPLKDGTPGFKDIESIPEKDLPYLQNPEREKRLAADNAQDLQTKIIQRQLEIDIETELADKFRRFCWTGGDYLTPLQFQVLWEFYQNDLTISQIVKKLTTLKCIKLNKPYINRKLNSQQKTRKVYRALYEARQIARTYYQEAEQLHEGAFYE